MTWLDTVVRAYSDNEAPERFFYWAGMAALSAVVRKNVYLDKFHYKLYPNVYVFIVAASGMRKGVPVVMAKDLVSKSGCARIVSGRNSVQKIISDLGNQITLESGIVINSAHAFLVSGELAAFLIKDSDAMNILTDIHDTHSYEEKWEYSLKSEVSKLKSPCITLLGASNEENLQYVIPTASMDGGFIARTFIVYSNEIAKVNPLTTKPTYTPDTKLLAEYLKCISKVKGEFKYTPKGQTMYEDWYHKTMTQRWHDPTGSIRRLGDQVLKAAMLISLSESESLVITESHIFEAITQCEICMNGTLEITRANGAHNLAAATRIVLKELVSNPNHKTDRSTLINRYMGRLDSFDIDRIIESLIACGAIDVLPGKNPTYTMKQKAISLFTDFKNRVM